ncbi:AAA family ATPase [Gordonia soli]|uniref:Nuclease SbcCD subunit C n=1 Tax=Gordonia soli NBRC 108243 TaxID=1223545 RepID=M0QS42_9ACTN|nr:SMC family ATPase [Gordonia soli]GAC70792.1 nuclease SbcCD subunit C [Gordonia soli NBRC 108243]
MRVHHLRMKAFGPFADEAVIDVDRLSEDGLFLLHGPTGAGKTTVLDAIAFALFGRVPGARGIKRLHSDHARPEDVPEVVLEATIAGRRLRITRSPEHLRPKRRAAGTTKVQAKATLVWVDGSGPDLTRLPEIGDAVVRLLGMSAEQFFQVVLLPQGEFARFLRANPDEREELLERLFDTERFGDLEDWLRDQSRASAAALAERMATLDRLAGQIAAVGGVELPTDPAMEWAEAALDAARETAQRTAESADVAQRELDRVHRTHDEASRLAAHRRRGVDATARLTALDARAGQLESAALALAAARRTATIAGVAEGHDHATAAADDAERDHRAAVDALADLPEGATVATQDVDAVEAAITRWNEESGRWEPLARRVSDRSRLVDEIARIDAQRNADDRQLGELQADLDAAPARRSAIVASIDAASAAGNELHRLEVEHARLGSITTALTDHATALRARAVADVEVLDARESHSRAREHLLDLRERRVAGMAAELAATLAEGEACVVCGSTEHPAPATDTAAPTGVDAAAERAAEREVTAAEERRTEAVSVTAALAERIANLEIVIDGASADAVAADVERTASAVAVARATAAELPRLQDSLLDLDGRVTLRRNEISEMAAAAAGREERLRSLTAERDRLDAEVAEATGGRIGVAERRRELAELATRAARVRDTLHSLVRARDRHTESAERLRKACAAAGFDDVGAARAAVATPTQVAEWERDLADAATARAAAEETLTDPDVRAAVDSAPADLEALGDELAAARSRRDVTANDAAVARHRVAELEVQVSQFWAAADGLEPVRARHAELAGLAELVSGRGQNARRMSLRSYVLAARLEEVLIAASARLRQMSSGRYEFVHSDAAGPRNRRGGLGIEVRDEYTGMVRAATTLSGGETFIGSLALALGLADVVSAESGGRVLDTIFIDEGFGTLDPEALDLVMAVLDELRSGGRVVGVVSHVEGLRARIPVQLHVQRTELGSRVRVEGAVGVS